MRAQHITIHKSFIYAAFTQDMADPLPIIALAAHATNREQRLPNGFTGYTSNASVRHAAVKQTAPHARTVSAASTRGGKVAAMSPKQSSDVLSRAVNVLGTPTFGVAAAEKGFDCSGLVKYAFNDVANVDLPRTSNAMAQGHGVKVAKGELKPGDLIFSTSKAGG